MKAKISCILAVLLIFSFSNLVSALEEKPESKGRQTEWATMGSEGAAKSDMIKQQEKIQRKMTLVPMMMREIMTKSIVATVDGGVVVMIGNKLMKFDKDLNLVKEAEVKIDIEGMEKMMMEMMPEQVQCPLPKKMMHKDKMKEGGTTEGTAQESGAKQQTPAQY